MPGKMNGWDRPLRDRYLKRYISILCLYIQYPEKPPAEQEDLYADPPKGSY